MTAERVAVTAREYRTLTGVSERSAHRWVEHTPLALRTTVRVLVGKGAMKPTAAVLVDADVYARMVAAHAAVERVVASEQPR